MLLIFVSVKKFCEGFPLFQRGCGEAWSCRGQTLIPACPDDPEGFATMIPSHHKPPPTVFPSFHGPAPDIRRLLCLQTRTSSNCPLPPLHSMYQLQTGSERSACCCSFSLNTRIGLSRNGSHGTSTLLLGEGMGQVLLAQDPW